MFVAATQCTKLALVLAFAGMVRGYGALRIVLAFQLEQLVTATSRIACMWIAQHHAFTSTCFDLPQKRLNLGKITHLMLWNTDYTDLWMHLQPFLQNIQTLIQITLGMGHIENVQLQG